MSKKYSDYMNEISADDVYKGLLAHGLFSEKLPPIFTSEEFYQYSLSLKQPFSKVDHGYISFDTMRDINIPRTLGIPNPMAYERLCACIRDNWDKIKKHFSVQTEGNNYKISRIHIRKQSNSKALFKMNYKNWKTDDSPVPDILIGKKYMVSADISTCFPSMYTHALCWALTGKQNAKNNRQEKEWYNELDHRCMELKSGETHGFIIGPHASNLLSEIILTVIDKHLSNSEWEYIRNIDDYTCYVESYEEAQLFLTNLVAELRCFDLPLNHKKTKIEELPVAATKHWVRQLNCFDFTTQYEQVNYKKVQSYLDMAVGLVEENGKNAAVLKYAIKVLSKQTMTKNAQQYFRKTILHLAIIYPYLIPLLDEYVFVPYETPIESISQFANIIFSSSVIVENYEAMIYAIYFALKYNFDIKKLKVDWVTTKDSCLLKCFSLLYYRKQNDLKSIKTLKSHARKLLDKQDNEEIDKNWLFIYEALPKEQLKGEWKAMKKSNISFIKKEYRC